MPPVSKKQAALFRSVAEGTVKLPSMTPEKAKEMVTGYPTRQLPERVTPKTIGAKRIPSRGIR